MLAGSQQQECSLHNDLALGHDKGWIMKVNSSKQFADRDGRKGYGEGTKGGGRGKKGKRRGEGVKGAKGEKGWEAERERKKVEKGVGKKKGERHPLYPCYT